MANTKTASELQRNIGAIYEMCDRTGEPVYITRNGQPSLVVMNADSFDTLLARHDELEEELALYKALMQSEIDRLSANTYSWDDVQRERAAMEHDAA